MDKKESELLDLTMGAYDSVEVCELVSSFLLYQLSNRCNKKDIGLYRDDSLAFYTKQKWSTSGENKEIFFKKFSEKLI